MTTFQSIKEDEQVKSRLNCTEMTISEFLRAEATEIIFGKLMAGVKFSYGLEQMRVKEHSLIIQSGPYII